VTLRPRSDPPPQKAQDTRRGRPTPSPLPPARHERQPPAGRAGVSRPRRQAGRAQRGQPGRPRAPRDDQPRGLEGPRTTPRLPPLSSD
jgi:hypothetical protein